MSLLFARDWPNSEASRHVEVSGVHWHVQVAGAGPGLLLLHGTGASTHSFRDLLPILTERFTVVAPDLPGHAFTRAPSAMVRSMPEMARALGQLLAFLGIRPELIVGHSAGAAIAIRMALDDLVKPRKLVSINGALLPFDGLSAFTFPVMAKLGNALRFLPSFIAARAGSLVDEVLRQSGSNIDERGVELYRRLVSEPSHVAGVLAMTAGWELDVLAAQLPSLRTPLLLVAGANDRVVPPERTERAHRLVPGSEWVVLGGLGHLAHEEDPEAIAELL